MNSPYKPLPAWTETIPLKGHEAEGTPLKIQKISDFLVRHADVVLGFASKWILETHSDDYISYHTSELFMCVF